MEEKLKALLWQRGAVEEKLTRVKTAVAEPAGMPNPNLKKVNFLKVHLETVKKCYSEFNGFQNDIYALALSDEQRKEQEGKYEEFETLYNELVIELNDLLDDVVKLIPNSATVPATEVVVQQYLPPLNVPLPTFDGTYESWFSFKCMFQNVMARYQAESPAIKLYHLRESLVGKAAGVIDQDIVNNNDYDAAWAILQERYEDKRLIIDNHIEALFALPKITPDSALELRKLIDTCVKSVEALKSFEHPVDGLGEQMLVNLLAARMDRETRKAWEFEQKAGELPSYAATIAFLKKQCRILERLECCASAVSTRTSAAMVIANEHRCTVCSRHHELGECEQFGKKCLNEKFAHFRKFGLCFNCSQRGHLASDCSLSNCCQMCDKRHSTLLHVERTTRNVLEQTRAAKVEKRGGTHSTNDAPQTLLPTVSVQVYGSSDTPYLCRALIDSCSENNFVTERFAKSLAIEEERVNYEVSGLNGGTTKLNRRIRAKVTSRVSNFETELELLVTPKIIGEQPVKSIDVSRWNVPPDVELADPAFNIKGRVDMLLGAAVFWDLIKTGRIELTPDHPLLTETELGWVVGGVDTSR